MHYYINIWYYTLYITLTLKKKTSKSIQPLTGKIFMEEQKHLLYKYID